MPKIEERRYATHFPHQTTRYIMWQMSVQKVAPQRNRLYEVEHHYYTAEGRLLGKGRRQWRIDAYAQRPKFSWGWGWSDAGKWTPGEYEVQILIDGAEFAWGTFVIN